ncbi:MAG: hypothetical protein AAF488_15555, partial [Planctomycetota bacterium]
MTVAPRVQPARPGAPNDLPLPPRSPHPEFRSISDWSATPPELLREPLPMSRNEMAKRGWDELDVIFVTGDAYIDHPSFAMAILGRVLEAYGYRVGMISHPDWKSADAFKALGRPRLFFAVSA